MGGHVTAATEETPMPPADASPAAPPEPDLAPGGGA